MIQYETDSRKIQPGQTFVAIKGHTVDGHDYIHQAVLNGASRIIAEREVDVDVPLMVVPNTSEYLTKALQEEYSEELKKLTLIGVTGTNGKTTTCYLTYQILKALGVKVAYMGTIGFYFEEEKQELPNTTPEILTIYKLFMDALAKGCTTIVMEVSSHALALKRIAGLEFFVGAFTNLTEDHLDYHKTMENYLQTKLELLDYMNPQGTFLVNIDDPASEKFMAKFSNTKTLGLKKSDYWVKQYSFYPDRTTIEFQVQEHLYEVTTHLTGKFNVYNYLTAVALVCEYGIALKDVLEVTPKIYPPKGRCETYKVKDGFAVVDYAHTPDAVLKVIHSYRELAQARIITVIGCGGDRDPLKRPIMGEIATRLSDYVIFTNDNPRTEDPKKIMEDILQGVEKENYEVVLDRHEAILKALDLISKDDIVLLLGKGHEDYQILGHDKIHFDDSEEVKKYIKKCEEN